MSHGTPPVPPADEPQTKPKRKILGGIGAIVALTLAVLGVIAATHGTGGHTPSADAAASGAPGPGSASGSSSGTGGGSGSSSGAGVHIGSTAKASAGSTVLTHPSIRLAPAADRAAAASVLTADDAHYRQELATGESLVGKPGFAAWAAQALGDTRDQADFARAAGEFTAADQPPALTTWHADNGYAVAALRQFAKDASGRTSTIASRTDAADTTAYLADADQIAKQVGAGQ
jgi:hypothetical protein